jgi:hypothetical protein
MLPCILLFIVTIALVCQLDATNARRHRFFDSRSAKPSMSGYATTSLTITPDQHQSYQRIPPIAAVGKSPTVTSLKLADRSTYVLLAMLAVFQLTELPQGCIAVLNAVYTIDVHRGIFISLGDFFDLLSLINCIAGFICYYCMSSVYRSATRKFFTAVFNRCTIFVNYFRLNK